PVPRPRRTTYRRGRSFDNGSRSSSNARTSTRAPRRPAPRTCRMRSRSSPNREGSAVCPLERSRPPVVGGVPGLHSDEHAAASGGDLPASKDLSLDRDDVALHFDWPSRDRELLIGG